MINLPPGFDSTAFFADIFTIVAPFAAIIFTIGAARLLTKLLKKA